jgi:hypothetical protein
MDISRFSHRASLLEPDGATAPGLPVLDGVCDNLKANAGEQRYVISKAGDATCCAKMLNIRRWSSGVS